MATQVEFSTLTEMFDRITKKYAAQHRSIYMRKVDGKYQGISYADFRQQVIDFACGLASLGIKRGDKVAIISENRPEWPVTDMATLGLGAVVVPLYPTLTPKQIEYIFKDSDTKVAVVSNAFQLNKVLKIRPDCKKLKHIIVMTDKGVQEDSKVLRFEEVLDNGRGFAKSKPEYFNRESTKINPSDLMTIIYTSGTTGNPKGVMLTHQNLVSNIISSAKVLPIDDTDVLLSFLPLCHVFERMAGYYTAMACGASVAYAESIDTVRDNLLEVHPTIVTTVPRLFERIYSRIMKQIESSPPARQKIFHWAISVGKQFAKARKRGSVPPALKLQHMLASKLVFSKLKERTGGKIRYFVSGGAALPQMLGEFFEAVGILVIEGYGLTETSPVLCANRLDNYKFGTVGQPIPGVEIKIAEDGEILARGKNIMQGYYNLPKETAAAIDKNGWFHTGDIGMFDEGGRLMITDRKKHLFVSSGGKNIAPQPIENLFLQSNYIGQFVLIGDGKMYLTALIVPDFDMLKEYAGKHKISYRDIEELIKKPEVNKLYQQEIDQLQKDLPNFERVRRFTLLNEEFTVENNLLTPSIKVRRSAVEKKYADVIAAMYSDASRSI